MSTIDPVEPTAADVIRAHEFDPVGRICKCGVLCGVKCDNLTYPQHLQDALDAAGFAIVALPEPNDNGDYGNVIAVGDDDLPEVTVRRKWLSPSEARETAAGLLAAANMLERAA